MQKQAARLMIGLLVIGAACQRTATADLTKARPVMDKFLEAQREHRSSHGNYWRGSETPISRDESVKNIGVDLADAVGFEFVAEPREDGTDTTLRVIARGLGAASNVSLACVLKAGEPKPDCKESAAAL
jgi:hypothetical protein